MKRFINTVIGIVFFLMISVTVMAEDIKEETKVFKAKIERIAQFNSKGIGENVELLSTGL